MYLCNPIYIYIYITINLFIHVFVYMLCYVLYVNKDIVNQRISVLLLLLVLLFNYSENSSLKQIDALKLISEFHL